uniref:Uncharacterized protein n=1 Tax=Cacopsylla melanoneura TaxID=428564 RepID=A0A8D9BJD4_9HEMI
MSHSFGTAIPHVFLTGISFWSLRKLPENSPFGIACYSFYVASGILGIITYGAPTHGLKIRNIYYKLWNISMTIGLPLYTTQLYLSSGISLEISILNMLLPLTLLFKLIKVHIQPNMLCTASVALLSAYKGNYYGISTAISCFIAEFGIHMINGEVPPKDLFTYALSFAQFFSLKALLESVLLKSLESGNSISVMQTF